jgi:hypothetical protein
MLRSACLAFALLAAPALAADVDWAAVAAPDVVRILTRDPDGSARDRKVWIALHDGTAWLRTGNSRWLENIRRDPHVKLRSGEQVFELSAQEVTDPAVCDAVDAAMRAKYGWADRVLMPFRWRASHVIRLAPRSD